jgi:hypothetical protein
MDESPLGPAVDAEPFGARLQTEEGLPFQLLLRGPGFGLTGG